jgi:hypothetical protein
VKTSNSKVEMQVVVRDANGNIKYQGPLVMDVIHEEQKEQVNGGNSSNSGQDGDC